MPATTKYLKIKDIEIPTDIKSYKNSKSVKIYFKGNTLNVTKPTRVSMSTVLKILKEDEENLYNKYKKILDSEISTIKQWKTGEKIYYRGEEYTIVRKTIKSRQISLDLKEKQIIITLPEEISQDEAKAYGDEIIKKLLKNNT